MKQDYHYSRFQYLYKSIIQQSKNIPIPEPLSNDIVKHFQNNIILEYTRDNLLNLSKNYIAFAKEKNYILKVYIIENNDQIIIKNFKDKLPEFIETTLYDIKQGLQINAGIYIPCKFETSYLILNYTILKDHLYDINEVIDHELTHFFDIYTGNQWQDLLPRNRNQFINEHYNQVTNVSKILFLLNLNYQSVYYLTSKNEFEAFCTIIEKLKNKINLNDALNLKYFNSNQFQQLPIQVKNIYKFIFVNKFFDKSEKRIEYIKENLN